MRTAHCPLARTGIPARRRAIRPVLLGLALGLGIAAQALAIDPFYDNILRKGIDAYNRHDYKEAVKALRVACFGMLDEPEALADGLVRLSLAQAAAGDQAGFTETYRRVAEVEERFVAYSHAAIPAELRREFERLLIANVPRATLAVSPYFARLLPKPEDRVAALPARQRRKELERLIAAEPRTAGWSVMLAALELETGNEAAAVERASAALAIDPENVDALRVRGLAEAARKHWPAAAADLAASGKATVDPPVAEAHLRALVELERFSDAGALIARLPVSYTRLPGIRALAERVAAAAPRPTAAPRR